MGKPEESEKMVFGILEIFSERQDGRMFRSQRSLCFGLRNGIQAVVVMVERRKRPMEKNMDEQIQDAHKTIGNTEDKGYAKRVDNMESSQAQQRFDNSTCFLGNKVCQPSTILGGGLAEKRKNE